MKKRAVRWMKRAASSILAVALVVAGSFMMDTKVEAADDTIVMDKDTKIAYQKFSNYEYYIGQKIPAYSGTDTDKYGYVFGGWFTSSDKKNFTSIASIEDVKDDDTVYAKFVPAYVLSVKCQNQAGTAYTTGGTGSTNLKVISSMDSVSYKEYGFDLDLIFLDADGNVEKKDSFSKGETATTVYEKFNVYDKDGDAYTLVETQTPNEVFGSASKYFTTWGVTGIPESSYGTIIHIKPYWVTKDNMKVYGLSKYAHVEDGLIQGSGKDTYRYVNVPVNLRATQPVAAGVLSVDYKGSDDQKDFTFYEAEGGVIFEEMAWNDKGTSVKVVGNVKDISENKGNNSEDSNELNDIYVNLRFKVPSSSASDFLNGYIFSVTDEDFSDIAENQYDMETYDVWNVKY